MTAEANVMPTESERKVFIVPDADKMNAQAANAFLKLLEEPPPRVVFFLMGERVMDFLQTIRSRCNIIEVSDSGDVPNAEPTPEARAIFGAFARRDAAGVANELIKAEKAKREDLEALINGLYMLFAENAALNPQFAIAAEIAAEPARRLRGGMNLGAGHIIGALMVRLNRLIV
jgi:DNA polymerase-3 subunit delta'